ncbi:RsmB/NOP family class I SAM-dependent RNA methyltransferase [Shewanella salipaludis]|uniref:RsmB/NOP family class I SAM-dependent RNA methyltransferase n=1 Tax=Shewanella salipaludis TaxID=2723052 RepID=A0A972FZV8_9GAMM|nr:RsmB/NOP family class I SAM-dependent RNA methyltransferase [Shewanella salipaludis]NMH64619.1 RsmB/NOP family class I SAM-dependent RNA methyltransferase [Shewanella salipaludis]
MTSIPNHDSHSQAGLQATTPAQKRALSHANTIKLLFAQVLQDAQPADRVLANYFREHKKHGSKDRRVIRETLFGLFRWWGWLQKLGAWQQSGHWFAMLSGCALLEAHPWRDIRDAWQGFSGLDTFPVDIGRSLAEQQALMAAMAPEQTFTAGELVPAWFWRVCPLEGEQQTRLIEALCSRPPIWARAQKIGVDEALTELKEAALAARASEYFDDAINLGHKSMNLNELALYKAGKLEIQDLASQVIGRVCAPAPNELWWDACSGAGGKSLQLRSLMLQKAAGRQSQGSIVASDIRTKALEELGKRALRAGFEGISLARWQSDELPVPLAHFDGVLVDAPCSCTGTWRRNPDMRWLDGPDSVMDKTGLQLDILSRSSRAVKPGGILVYATCSLAPAENQDVVSKFLALHDEFELQTLQHPFTGESTQMLTVWPFEANSDGMFVARMQKRF